MRIKKNLFLIALSILSLNMMAQSMRMTAEEQLQLAKQQPEVMSSVYRAYPHPTGASSPVPDGYAPVFLSHYGRHGSRYLTEDKRYADLINLFEKNALTDKGRDVLKRIRICKEQAQGRGGDLTRTGELQHREIAERMYRNFPSLFTESNTLTAYSSTSRRCMMSMMAFCERLKELNPSLIIPRDVCEKNMEFIAKPFPEQSALIKDTKQASYKAYASLKNKLQMTKSFMARLFVRPEKIKDAYKWMEELFFLAQNMQDCGRPTELLDIFTPEELYSVWCIKNASNYLIDGDSPLSRGIPAMAAGTLLDHIINDADQALEETKHSPKANNQETSTLPYALGKHTATLRFGHDTSLLRLLTRMKVKENCPATSDLEQVALVWQDFSLAPMAANLQIIFYQNAMGKTLVRLLLNENEVHLDLPATNTAYYDWQAVKNYWKQQK